MYLPSNLSDHIYDYDVNIKHFNRIETTISSFLFWLLLSDQLTSRKCCNKIGLRALQMPKTILFSKIIGSTRQTYACPTINQSQPVQTSTLVHQSKSTPNWRTEYQYLSINIKNCHHNLYTLTIQGVKYNKSTYNLYYPIIKRINFGSLQRAQDICTDILNMSTSKRILQS